MGTAKRAPRKSTRTKSAIARLRDFTGLSQKDFAKVCGIKLETYKTMEKRSNATGTGISKENALLVAAATGASPGYLVTNQLRAIGTVRAYNKKDYAKHIYLFETLLKTGEKKRPSEHLKSDRWKDDTIVVIQNRMDEILDEIKPKGGTEFVTALLLTAMEVDKLASKLGLDGRKRKQWTELSVLAEATKCFNQKKEPTRLEYWERLKVEDFALLYQEAAEIRSSRHR